jgi:pilus assembly protein CpaE
MLNLDILNRSQPRNDVARTVVGYTEGALGSAEVAAALAEVFPNVDFVNVGPAWPTQCSRRMAALIISAGADEVEPIAARLGAAPAGLRVIVALSNADIATSRSLMRAGAADVLAGPVSEAALGLSLERLLADAREPSPIEGAPAGKVIGLLKAGGGAGATAVGAQLAAMLAARKLGGEVCFADLDLQFGQARLYFDMDDPLSLSDVLGGGQIEQAPLASALATHSSGARLLAAPRELMPIDALSTADAAALIGAMRRDFSLSIVDLPSVWTAWTNRTLELCDRIILFTQLTVPHINLAKRQIKMLNTQGLEGVALTVVCNQLSPDQTALLPIKTAERALGQSFNIVIPEDRRLMNDAIAQGCEISKLRRGSKLERAIAELADVIAEVEQPKARKGLFS